MSFKITNPKFTEGPWSVKFSPTTNGTTLAEITSAGGEVHSFYCFNDQDMANARLMAAGPELFDALCAVHLLLENVVSGFAREDLERIIKKARGDEKTTE